jgi:uncharacterized protein YfaQ (DUF2300 family)
MHKRSELRRSVRRRLATLAAFIATVTLMGSLSSCGEEAKEDPAEEQQREVQQQVEQPQQTEASRLTITSCGESLRSAAARSGLSGNSVSENTCKWKRVVFNFLHFYSDPLHVVVDVLPIVP